MTEISKATRSAETVLIVDGDRHAGGQLAAVLRARGYQVLSVTTADAALRIAGDRGTAIDLLLTDVRMPEMSGPELAGRLLEQRPSMAVMYMSSQSSDVLPTATDQTDVPFVLKPCTPQALRHSVAETLRKMSAPAAASS
jgi:two-component system, cell cycle sensor histidine kinase and response regulator CckA